MTKAISDTYRLTLPLVLVKLITLLLPTAFIIGFVFIQSSRSFTGLDMQPLILTIWFTISLIAAFLIFVYRGRFIVFTLILLLILWMIRKSINQIPGEFDVFVAVARFELNAVAVILGWLCGFVFARGRYFIPIIGALILTVVLIALSRTTDLSISYWLLYLLPVIAWVLYMLFMAPTLQYVLDVTPRRLVGLALRVVIFLISVALLFWLVLRIHEPVLQAKKGEIEQRGKPDKDGKDGEAGYNEKKGLLKRRPGKFDRNGKPVESGEEGEGGYQLKDTLQISDRMSQNDYIMFCSKLDNFFPDGSPKPLYYVFQHLTKYDPVSETFTLDTAMPSSDELNIDPTEIGLYKTKTDSTIIKKSKAEKFRRVVEAEVYMTNNVWNHSLLAPGAAFSVQPISIDKTFDTIFTSAYRVKSYATELTTTYAMERYQYKPNIIAQLESSYRELNNAADYQQTDPNFLNYYVNYPNGTLYDSIRALALTITKEAKTPIEKVSAIEQYFRSKDKNGEPLYRYTLRPDKNADPNIPTGSMLRKFLFRTHAGYCTYYAGATMLLLRAVGIPCRFTTGFATFDRSDKNKGWYWYYGRQAHAWIQVYFEGYGWIDFDTTVGNADMSGAPKPDGTPPVPPPNELLAIRGISLTKAENKIMRAEFREMTWLNKEHTLRSATEWQFDLSRCRVKYGKKDTTLNALAVGDSLTMITYLNSAKNMPIYQPAIDIDAQLRNFPNKISVDELHIQPSPEKRKEEPGKRKKEGQKKSEYLTIRQLIGWTAGIVGGLLILLMLTPFLIWLGLRFRVSMANDERKKVERIYRLALFTFHQTVTERGEETPMHYATQKIDTLIQMQFAQFMQIYHKLKYSIQPLDEYDRKQIQQFYPEMIQRSQHFANGRFRWWLRFINLARAQRFLRRPHTSDELI